MSRLRVISIVEGHGETEAVRPLIRRIWCELLGGEYVEVLQPLRVKRQKIVKKAELKRAVEFASRKLYSAARQDCHNLVLVLIDADKDAPCLLGPELLQLTGKTHANLDVSCVIANVEYETWFVAAAESLADYLRMSKDETIPDDPEQQHCGKGWIKKRFAGKYSETVDQPSMTAKMDLALCRKRSPSFCKLCRELEKRLRSS